MKTKIIAQIKEFLDERGKVFLNEKDIQLYLAQKFIESKEYDDVFMEYHIPIELLDEKNIDYPWNNKNNIYIDIVLEKDNSFYPIEIKYKTKKQKLKDTIFGEEEIKIELKKQGAQNIGRYDFWKDVKRIELFEKFEKVGKESGIILFITNDEYYEKDSLNKNVGYANFSMHQGREVNKETLEWKKDKKDKKDLSISNKRPAITLENRYKINWIEMKKLNSEFKFKYILL